MPTYEMRAPNGRTYRIQGPAGATDAQVKAKILEQHPEAARAAPAPKAKAKPKKSFLKRAEEFGEAALTGVAEGIRPVSEFAQRLDPTRPVFEAVQDIVTPGARQANERRFRQQVERVKRESPNTFTGGKIVGEIVSTAPIAGVAGAGIKAVGGKVAAKAPAVGRSIQRIGRAVQTGGLGTGRTAAQTTALSRGARVGQLAERMAGGAISGAITTGAGGGDLGDVGEGALFGAGLPIVANIAKRVGGKGADILRAPRLKAAEIIREALGKDVEATRQVLSQLSLDDQRLAQQVMIEAGLEPRAFFGIGKSITEQVDPDTAARVLAQQAAARETALADISGGTTATERRQAIELGRGAVSAVTTPLREAALQGRGPVEVEPILATLRAQANSTGIRTSAARGALLRLAKNIENGADEAGFINPADLYTIRKEAGDTIEKLVSSKQQPSSGAKKRTASIVMGFRQIVDDALGPDFKSYLARHREGMSAMDRQELAAEAANLAQTNPNQFINLMRGGRDETVEDVMGRGTGQYDIGALETTDPRRYATMMNAVREFETLNKMQKLGREGSARAADIMRTQQPGLMERGVGLLLRTKFPALSFATSGAQNIETATLSPRVRERLANAFVSGPSMREAMEQYPTAFNFSEQVSSVPGRLRNVMAQGLVRPITADFPEIDPETGEILLEVGFNEDGSTYPIYGRPPAR
jgi:hypothetical protein